jgi:pimeloyl-ACP methyl ester carboxylesterase
MKVFPVSLIALGLGLTATLAGCPGMTTRPPSDAEQPVGGPGPAGVSLERASFRSVTGCEVDTTRFEPEHPRTDTVVILAHGFLRDERRMQGLAGAMAASGIPTYTMSFCNSRPWDGGHRANAADMRKLAGASAAPRVIYAGFSAGGLSALIAAREDPRTLGVLTLDLVDDGNGLGASMAAGLDRPLIGLTGEPAACNAQSNGLAVYAASPRARVAHIRGASHCDFEAPTDWLCRSVCGPEDEEADARRAEIIRTSVAAVADLLGLPPAGERWASDAALSVQPSARAGPPRRSL